MSKDDNPTVALFRLGSKLAGEHIDADFNVADAIYELRRAILPFNGQAASGVGGSVSCLTEAVMDVAHANSLIADAINNLADAVRESRPVPPE